MIEGITFTPFPGEHPAEPDPPAPSGELAPASTGLTPAAGMELSEATLWPVSTRLDPGVDWLRHAATDLHERFGLPGEASIFLPLGVLGAIVGPTVWLRGPEGLSVHPSINIGWIAKPGSRFGDAQAMVYAVPMTQLGLARTASKNVDPELEQKKLAQLFQALSLSESSKSKAKSDYAARCRDNPFIDPDAELPEVKQAEARIRSLKRKIEEALLRLRPGLIVTDADLKELLNPAALAFDGAVVNLGADGGAVRQLHAATKGVRMATSAMAQRVWRSEFRSEKMSVPDHESVSHQWTLSPADAGALMRDGALKACGMAGTMLLVGASLDKPVRLSGGMLDPEALEGMQASQQACWERRLSGEPMLLELATDAGTALMQWVDERSRHASVLDLADPGVLRHLSSLALKIILLLHLARDGVGRVVGTETVKAALHLTDALIAGDLQLRADNGQPGRRALAGGESEVELIYARLRLRGPQTLRDLTRSFHRKATAEVEQMVAAAVEAGFVEEVEGKYAPVEAEIVGEE
jgi:hypothetical protein